MVAWKSSNVMPSRAAVAAVMSVAMKPGATAFSAELEDRLTIRPYR
jgi:hypothetical protein